RPRIWSRDETNTNASKKATTLANGLVLNGTIISDVVVSAVIIPAVILWVFATNVAPSTILYSSRTEDGPALDRTRPVDNCTLTSGHFLRTPSPCASHREHVERLLALFYSNPHHPGPSLEPLHSNTLRQDLSWPVEVTKHETRQEQTMRCQSHFAQLPDSSSPCKRHAKSRALPRPLVHHSPPPRAFLAL
ncbi:hypothetical protein LTR28_003967, partial [Elasticomyces elasticus]